jgi:hypothetical protein
MLILGNARSFDAETEEIIGDGSSLWKARPFARWGLAGGVG